ncbi:hypothetical protein J5N97_008572 [Dioscorea zingiberensis]|uniref:TF-B3 domain-containing protein n=1 Tax=Dioscorea zingiberensis TaxID=325984 RepID=A0A9D5CWK0_9LILI|nr:hypothetical protein J5N97_008572 [Dioscorea zingiberensis]
MVDDCESCKQWKEHYYWDHAKSINFFKVMNGDFSKQMGVPEKLTSHFCKVLPQNIELKGPSGDSWSVKMVKMNGSLWFGNGWKEFVEAHCVEMGDVLVFKYYGNSFFDVLVMDGSGCEKVPSYFVKNKKKQKIECVERVEDSVEIIHVPPCSPTLVECDSSSSSDGVQSEIHYRANQSKRNFTNYMKNTDQKIANDHRVEQEQVEVLVQKKLSLENIIMSRKKCFTPSEEKSLLLFVQSVRPKHPFFVSYMHLSYVSKRFFLTVPSAFASAYLPDTTQQIVLQRPGGGKKWSVIYLVQKIAAGFSGQWKQFVNDNNLEEGDICLFELVENKKKIRMSVHFWQRRTGDGS